MNIDREILLANDPLVTEALGLRNDVHRVYSRVETRFHQSPNQWQEFYRPLFLLDEVAMRLHHTIWMSMGAELYAHSASLDIEAVVREGCGRLLDALRQVHVEAIRHETQLPD